MRVQQERVRNQSEKDEGVTVRPSRRANRLDPYNNEKYIKSPLPHPKRWLRKQLGRSWDDVYSEICTKFLKHTKNWYWDFYVLQNVSIKNGKIYNDRGIEIVAQPEYRGSYVGYIHPETGVFTKMPTGEGVKRGSRTPIFSPVFGNDGAKFMLVRNKKGSWFCRFNGVVRGFKEYDCLLKQFVNYYTAYDYYGRGIHVTSKRQITSKEYLKLTTEIKNGY